MRVKSFIKNKCILFTEILCSEIIFEVTSWPEILKLISEIKEEYLTLVSCDLALPLLQIHNSPSTYPQVFPKSFNLLPRVIPKILYI